MCGIAGIMMRDGRMATSAALAALASALAHRGPDGQGRYLEGSVGLLNTRLAIIDVDNGRQPFEDTRAVLVANGEIYNDLELRAQMKDAVYRSQSDCESALHLYHRDGVDFPASLRGMFGIALYDKQAKTLILARDPFGIKQLYYVTTDAGFAFASEAQALIAAGFAEAGATAQARAELLQLKFTVGAETIFPGIYRLLPGETLVVADGRVRECRRRDALPRARAKAAPYAETLRQLDAVLHESVALHMRSEVPYGLFLSGGIDSSVLATLMAEIAPQPVVTLTATFPDAGARDESEAAKRIAEAVKAEHTPVPLYARDFWQYAPQAAAAIDDPTADAAVLPTFLLGKAAAARGLKVVLSGEGSDEIFGGYSRYRRASWLGGLFTRPSRTRGVLSKLGIENAALSNWRARLAETEKTCHASGWTGMQTLQALDCAEWLPNDLLVKLDRCLMAHGVEGRTPFLDSEVGRFAFSLPDGMKVKRNRGKYLLRDWLARKTPAADPWSKKKGFNPPIGDWMEQYKDRLASLVARQPGIKEIGMEDGVNRIFAAPAQHAQPAWSLVFYALWHSRHVLGADASGTVEEVLEQAARLG